MKGPLAQVSVVSPQNVVDEPSSASRNLTSPQPWTLEHAETSHHLAAIAHPMFALGQGPLDRGHGKSQQVMFSSFSSLAEEPSYSEALERRSPLGEDALSCWGLGPCKPPTHPDGLQVRVPEQIPPPFRQDPFPFFLSSFLVGFPGNPTEVALCLSRSNG